MRTKVGRACTSYEKADYRSSEKMTVTKCKIANCGWSGDVDYLLDHFERSHGRFFREIADGNRFNFTFDEVLQYETFLLLGKNGLYWFTQSACEQDDGFTKGVFSIGTSEKIDYTLKIGTNASGHVYHLGPYRVEPDGSNYYQLFFSFDYVEFINKYLAREITLFLGEYDDSDDVFPCDDSECFSSEGAVGGAVGGAIIPSNDMLEKYKCQVCWDYIKKNARFCKNNHFLCNTCFNTIIRSPNPKCPTCRGNFATDPHCDEIEKLLESMKFPSEL